MAVDASGKRQWGVDVSATTPIIYAAGSVWVGTGKDTVVRIDPASGGIVKRYMLGSAPIAEPAIHDGWIYATTAEGLVGVDTGDVSITGWSQLGGNAQRSAAEKASSVATLHAGP